MKRNARWYGLEARVLLSKLRACEARRSHWRDTPATNIMADINAVLVETICAEPQELLMSYGAYMVLTGHAYVKLGRRGGKWLKT